MCTFRDRRRMNDKITRRGFISTALTSAVWPSYGLSNNSATPARLWHEDIAMKASKLNTGNALQILIPVGSMANMVAVTDAFTRLTDVPCTIEEVPLDDISVELILRSRTGDNSVDVALPATYAITDLVQANALLPLDDLAARHEPQGFSDGYLYRIGDHYKNTLYGYQTDGDVYLVFYNKGMMLDPAEQAAYLRATGKPLAPATSWEDLDSMMAFFQRPAHNQYGGNLLRNPEHLTWEWWARFHATGSVPFTQSMRPNINNDAGVAALEEMIAASQNLAPGAASNGIFENWKAFDHGNIFCNMGWGGTQKYLRSTPIMRDNLIISSLPGPKIGGKPSTMGYFNWGWDYTVSANSTQPELAYLFTLFCATPGISTVAVRQAGGFFDPFRAEHYTDPEIRKVYGDSFLEAHAYSMTHCIPDLYMSGQSNYMDALAQHIHTALINEQTAKEALDLTAQQWLHITRRLGQSRQAEQWQALLASYPQQFRSGSGN